MLAQVFKVILTVAALFSVPVASYLAGHDTLYQVAEFMAALLALFLPRPAVLPAAKKPTEPDL